MSKDNVTIEIGEIAYTERGEAVEVVERLKSGYLVKSIMQYGEDDYMSTGNPFLVDSVYPSAPTEKLDAKIAELEATIKGLSDTRALINAEIMDLRRTEKERAARHAQIKQLELLDLFIEGKITHYVSAHSYSPPRIIDFKDTKCEYSRGQLRLLTLYGNSQGDLAWHLGRYSDHSGGSEVVTPCTSYEQALEVLTELVLTKIESSGLTDDLLKSCNMYGIAVEQKHIDALEQKKANNIQQQIARAEEKLQELRDALSATSKTI